MTRLLAAAIPLLLAACAPPLGPVALKAETPECFVELPITAQLVAEAGSDAMTFHSGSAGVPPFLVGHLSYLRGLQRDPPVEDDVYLPHGGVLFVKGETGWRALLPSDGEAAVGVYVSTRSPDVYVLSQLQVEGPGQSFTLTRSTDGLKTAACSVIDFPEDLNQPSWAMEYVTPSALQITARASGELVGSADLDQETDQTNTVWYRYVTDDGGQTWSAPERLPSEPAAAAGDLIAVTTAAPADLIADLKAYAAGK